MKRFILGATFFLVGAVIIGEPASIKTKELSFADLENIYAGNGRECVQNSIWSWWCPGVNTCVGVAPPDPHGGAKCQAAGAACITASNGVWSNTRHDRCGDGKSCCSITGLNMGACAAIFNGTCSESSTPKIQTPPIGKVPPIVIPQIYFCKCKGDGKNTGMQSKTRRLCD
jgi:hypothetical protein